MAMTISLTDASDNERIIVLWKNITHFCKGASTGKTWLYLTSGKHIRVKESLLKIEQLIEQAARE